MPSISRYPKMCHFHRTIEANFEYFLAHSWLKHKNKWQSNDRLRKKFIKHLRRYIPIKLYRSFYNWYKNWELKQFADNCIIPEVKDLVNENWFKKVYQEHQNEMMDVIYNTSLKQLIDEEDKNAFDLMKKAA